MTISKIQISQARKIIEGYLSDALADWFTPASRDVDFLAEAMLQDIQRFEGSVAVAEFLESKTVGDWDELLDELMNEIFLDQPDDMGEWY